MKVVIWFAIVMGLLSTMVFESPVMGLTVAVVVYGIGWALFGAVNSGSRR